MENSITFFLISIFLFILGLCFGSMWSVLVYRLMLYQTINDKKNKVDILKSIFFWRSKCTVCNHILQIWDLIPLFSWFILKWKCRYCWSKISVIYPILEFWSWLIFVLTFWFLSKFFYRNTVDFWIFYIILVINFYLFYLLVIGDILYYHLIDVVWILWFLIDVLLLFFWLWNFKIGVIWWIIFVIWFMSIYYFWKIYVRLRFWLKDVEWFGLGDVMVGFVLGLMLWFLHLIYKFTYFDIIRIFIIYIFLSSFVGVVIVGLYFLYNFFFKRQKIWRCIQFLPPMFIAWLILVFYLDKFLSILWI